MPLEMLASVDVTFHLDNAQYCLLAGSHETFPGQVTFL